MALLPPGWLTRRVVTLQQTMHNWQQVATEQGVTQVLLIAAFTVVAFTFVVTFIMYTCPGSSCSFVPDFLDELYANIIPSLYKCLQYI